MSVSKQLFALQEVDFELEASKLELNSLTARVGESAELVKARSDLTVEQQKVEEIRKQLRFTETNIKDLEMKIKAGEDELYSGNIRNPKELSNLQADVNLLKGKKGPLEDRALDLMYQSEEGAAKVEDLKKNYARSTADWETEQKVILAQIETVKEKNNRLEREYDEIEKTLSPEMLELYGNLKKQKKKAVALVEKGTCQGCRIILPNADVARARSGRVVQCSSCGRILYIE